MKDSKRIFEEDLTQIVYVSPCANITDFKYVRDLSFACKEAGKKLVVREIPPKVSEIKEIFPHGSICLILDDLTSFSSFPLNLAELSSFHSHHAGITCIYSVQNPYQKIGKLDLVTVCRNLTARFIFYQTNDFRLFYTLNAQLFPERKGYLVSCLLTARAAFNCSYVLINTHPRSTLPRR